MSSPYWQHSLLFLKLIYMYTSTYIHCKWTIQYILCINLFSVLGQCYVLVSDLCSLPNKYKISTAHVGGRTVDPCHCGIVHLKDSKGLLIKLVHFVTEQGTRKSHDKAKSAASVFTGGRVTHQTCSGDQEKVRQINGCSIHVCSDVYSH